MLGLIMQILGFPAQRKCVSSECHAHSNPQERQETCAALKATESKSEIPILYL